MSDYEIIEQPEKPAQLKKALHIKVTCKYCGQLLGHFRVDNPGVFIPLEVELCPECLIGMSLNQQQTIVQLEEQFQDTQTARSASTGEE